MDELPKFVDGLRKEGYDLQKRWNEMTKHLRIKVFGLALLVLLFSLGARAETVVIYPRAVSEKDRVDAYPIQLLALALSKSGQKYQMRAHTDFMPQVRAIAELRANRNLDVIWTTTSAEREEQLLPVRIPIDRGLLGWRLLLIRESDAPQFAGIQATDLQKMVAGQGHDWPDTAILQNAGFRVDVASSNRDLFLMLGNKTVQYFPRSIHEIWGELEMNRDKHFIVEPTLALHYRAAMYFFVSRQNGALAESIRRGLELAITDGSFDRLFMEHFSAVINRSNLEGRQIIELPNPLLPALTPIKDKRYWLQVKPKTAVTTLR